MPRFGVIALAVWLAITGLAALIPNINFDGLPILMGILALIAAALLLIGK